MLAVIVVLIAVQIWNSTFRQGSTGQSWGKQVAKTRLIDEWTGRPLGADCRMLPSGGALGVSVEEAGGDGADRAHDGGCVDTGLCAARVHSGLPEQRRAFRC